MEKRLPVMNIGLVGHVDHGKTTLVQALTGKWVDTHSEEMRRGITIKLGYADLDIYYCPSCNLYSATPKCKYCFGDCEFRKAVSLLDAPGHESLLAIVLTGASLIDAALLLIAANEKCPQPQTIEHLRALEIAGINKIIIVQNKIDLVTKERALEHYNEIKEFVKGTIAENAPIIPVSAQQSINIEYILDAIDNYFEPPKKDPNKEPIFLIARSFDANKPGTNLDNLKGGVIGGTLLQGKLKIGDEIEILPGAFHEGRVIPLRTKILNIQQRGFNLEEVNPSGLVGIETSLDPWITKNDKLAGNLAGYVGKLPPVRNEVEIEYRLFENFSLSKGDRVMISCLVNRSLGVVEKVASGKAEIKLSLPICAKEGTKISISKQIAGRWCLIGYGKVI